MKIELLSSYKSLKPFVSEELPDFCVIIGKNGSGKSQLVEKFMRQGPGGAEKDESIKITPTVTRSHVEKFEIYNLAIGDPVTFRSQVSSIFNNYNEYMSKSFLRKAWQNLFLKGISKEEIEALKMENQRDAKIFKDILTYERNLFVNEDFKDFELRSGPSDFDNLSFPLFPFILGTLTKSLQIYKPVIEVAKYHKKDITELSEIDFLTANLPQYYFDNGDLVNARIDRIFYNYLRKRDQNNYQFYQKSQLGKYNPSVNETDFDIKNPNPINQINEIFNALQFPYYFKRVEAVDFSPEVNVNFDLIKKKSNVRISFGDLSSGEKIIFGLILQVFTSNFYQEHLKFPELMIFDEPDAHLHPQMSKTLIDVLYKTFVQQIGIKVIITTHSPTTVALAPENSIFQLNNEPETFLKKIAKKEALKLLTSDLPTLSIGYESHRQIFVESPTDRIYYQTLFDKLLPDLNLSHNLYFISNGHGKGNCEQVKKIVGDLRNAGNETSYGIIDWDEKNNDTENVFVHGHERRYSIENYIFDPIYVAILLLENDYGKLKNAIGYTNSENQYDLIKSSKAQQAIDFIVSTVKKGNNQSNIETVSIEHKYGNNVYKIPSWYTNLNGHKLKEQLIKLFEPLENIKNGGEYEVENCLINIIGKVYPHAPEDTINILKKLAL